jgi:uncharacterized protein DUF2561
MPSVTDSVGSLRVRPGSDPGELDRTDRILLGACAAIWLAALGAFVAATVALIDLGNAHQDSSGDSGTPWLLYIVIAISAAVIIGAVPLLIRARRDAISDADPPSRSGPRQAAGRWQESARGDQTQTEKLRISDTSAGRIHAGPGYAAAVTHSTSLPAPLVAAIDQVWLRCAVLIACAIGIAMVAIGVATYLLAVESDTAAWVLLGLAGLVTLAMPAIPWFYLRELRALLEAEGA